MGEELVVSVLTSFGISMTNQYFHPNISRLRYDVFFEYNGRQYLIEFDGKQHFVFSEFFHRTREYFMECRIRDRIKSLVALMTGYTLIRIDYNEMENVETILRHVLDFQMTGFVATNASLYDYLINPTESINRDVWNYYVTGLRLDN
jgi:hypothetical protein